MSSLTPLYRVTGYVHKPAPCALAALTGIPSEECERALRKHQNGMTYRGTPASAIAPAGLALGLKLTPVLAEGSTGWLSAITNGQDVFAGRLLVETGAGGGGKPHFLAAARMPGPSGADILHVADVLNLIPVPFHEREGNPGRNGDRRRMRNVWRATSVTACASPSLIRVVLTPQDPHVSEVSPEVHPQDRDALAPLLARALADAEPVPFALVGRWRNRSFPYANWRWAAEERDGGLEVRIFPEGNLKTPHLMLIGNGKAGTEALSKIAGVSPRIADAVRRTFGEVSPAGPWSLVRHFPGAWVSPLSQTFERVLASYWSMYWRGSERQQPLRQS